MKSDFFEEIAGLVIICGLLAVTFTLAVFLTPYVLLIGGTGLLGYIWYHHPARREQESRELTLALYEDVLRQTKTVSVTGELERALAHYPDAIRLQVTPIAEALLRGELLTPDVPEPPAVCNSVEGARYRDSLAKISQNKSDSRKVRLAVGMVAEAIDAVAGQAPESEGTVMADVAYCLKDTREAVTQAAMPFYQENDYNLFAGLRETIDLNLARAKGVYPEDYTKPDVVQAYLQGTPLEWLFELKVPFGVPEPLRYEHCFMVAGTGHGKTQTIQHHIAHDLADLGQKSVIVIDSQRELIDNILRLDIPKEQIVLIDPEDIDYPVAINLFSAGGDRLAGYSALEREQLRNSVVELYEFVLASIMDTSLTGQQSVIFRYVTRLMLEIPGATLHTFLDILEGGDYRQYIDRLEGVARSFFDNQFNDPGFKRMREAVIRRLYLILENRIFDRMFSNPESKFDLFAEMNAGKLILINTSKATLKETGTKAFGRFFIAMIAQAAAERALIPRDDRIPCIVYLDEAQEYLDKNVSVILSQARKQNIGLFMATQDLEHIPRPVLSSIQANTSIRMAGGTSAADARAMASEMNVSVDAIKDVPKLTFATYVKGFVSRAIPVTFPVGTMEALPKRDAMEELRAYQRARYAVAPNVAGEGFTMRDSGRKPPAEEPFEDTW
ncbi:type IV secretory system conjugative DNA transfer family protein [Rhodophyticola porphyridii]|uniref:ATP-binding protein n=1 Tax=Rhodophyticola porphyridii TaxID=1852017 RepID=A0A3L9YBD1_9RHOB|nr:ATP-binding protein [Rhodophyticola porphyridii]RMA43286.1 ATP-binding protein [Rhodophyticola porphyridii]